MKISDIQIEHKISTKPKGLSTPADLALLPTRWFWLVTEPGDGTLGGLVVWFSACRYIKLPSDKVIAPLSGRDKAQKGVKLPLCD